MVTGAIKKVALCLALAPICLLGQDDYYPPESFYGGGVGFSQMFLFQNMGQLDGFEMLGSIGDSAGFGFDVTKFSNPFILNGGEGFSSVTERIRIGGFAGVGTSFISHQPEITLFLDSDGDGIFDPSKEESQIYSPPLVTGDQTPDLQAKISIWVSGATIEYIFPLFRGLEVSAGSLFGLGRLNLSITQSSGSPAWKDQFTSIFKIGTNGLTPVYDANEDSDTTSADIEYLQKSLFPSYPINSAMSSLSGTFVNVQPYVAVKLQLLDRMGIRMTVGFNSGTIGEKKWTTDDNKELKGSPETVLKSLAVRAMIYFGL